MTTLAAIGLIAITAVSAVAVRRLHRRPVLAVWTSALAVVAWAVHLFLFGHQLLLVPVYLYLAVNALVLRALYRRPRLSIAPRFLGVVGILAASIGVVAVLLFSQPPLSELTGDYPVGVASVRLADRPSVSLAVHYPADIPGAYAPPPDHGTLLDTEAAVQAVSANLGLPSLYIKLFTPRRGYGYRGVPLSARHEQYPVVLLVPPDTWSADGFFALTAQLASRGYIVVSGDDLPPADLAALLRAGVYDQEFAGRLDHERMIAVLVGAGASGDVIPPVGGLAAAPYGLGAGELDRLTDFDLFTRFPGLLGLQDNAAVRAALLSVLQEQLEAAW